MNTNQKTNLELIHEVLGNFVNPVAFRELEARKLGFLFVVPCDLQSIYERCKLKNIDLLARPEAPETDETCRHELVLREYPSQSYGTCAYCGVFVY